LNTRPLLKAREACADGGFSTVGGIEPQFYAPILDKLGLTNVDARGQVQADKWPELKTRIASLFGGRTRDESCALLEGTDVCCAPVLSIDGAAVHPHNLARRRFPTASGAIDTPVAPRFSPLPEATRT
jgi:alpha-methylacyl-CoA racemase